MTSEPLRDRLLGSIADGQPVDWDAISAEGIDVDARTLRHLRLLAGVAEVHRTAGEESPPSTHGWSDVTDPGGANRRWGHLLLTQKIGEGAFGEVFRARDPWLDRDVALKLLKGVVAEKVSPSRILSEARTLARLRHPNVVCVYGADMHDGRLGMWMELVRGQTLAQILAGYGTFGAREASLIGQEVCRALAAVHGCGIVHKDLKAQNVMREAGGRLVLMDFGAGGTPLYLAPEVLSGSEPTTAGDIYALGVLLYHLVSGRYPVSASTVDDLKAAHLQGQRRRLIDERTDLPDDFVDVVERALSGDPSGRYASAGEMLEALVGRSTTGRATSGLAVASRAPDGDHSIAVLPFADLSAGKQLEYFCEGIAEEIISALTPIPGMRVVARTSAFRFLSSVEDVRQVGTLLNVGAVLEGSVRASGDRLRVVARLVHTTDGSQRWSQRFDCQLGDVFAVQEQIAIAAARALGVAATAPGGGAIPGGPSVQDVEAYTLYLKGRHCWNQRTEATLRKSADYFAAALAREPDYAEALAGLADAYTTLGLYGVLPPHDIMPKAAAAATRAIAAGETLAGPHATAGCIAAVYDWNWTVAEQHFARAFRLNPRDPVAHHWHAIHYLVPLGRFAEARQALQVAALADPLSMPIRLSCGLTSYFAHDFPRAAREIQESLELDPGSSSAYLFLGLALTEVGRHREALTQIETAQRLSPTPEMTAALGYVRSRAGHPEAARAALAELQAAESARYISPSLMAQLHVASGDTGAALDALERALAVRAADLAWLGVRPVFDGLRGEERFAAVLREMGLTQLPHSTVG